MNPSFSLTKTLIIDRSLYWISYAGVCKYNNNWTVSKKVWVKVRASLIIRLVGIFTSVFAVADFCIHLGAGCYKGTLLLLKVQTDQQKDVFEHFKRAVFFTGVAFVGSLTALINPKLLEHFYYPADRPPPIPVVRCGRGRIRGEKNKWPTEEDNKPITVAITGTFPISSI